MQVTETRSQFSINTEDGRSLVATLFEPANGGHGNSPITVIAGGAGIPQRFYARFAAYVAQQGHAAMTFDYRDIGASRSGTLKGSAVRMRDWCTLDVPSVLAWISQTYPGHPIRWVGHSMGGFATGLAHNNPLITRQLNVATLNGYWRRMARPERYRVKVLMGMAGPPIARALGYFPGILMGGEDMPAPAFLEWVRWCMTPDFFFGDPTLTEVRHFAHFHAPIRFCQIEDDVWGTPPAVEAIANRFTANSERSLWRIGLDEAGASKIGHHGFFRDRFRDTLWVKALAWLDGVAATDGIAQWSARDPSS